MKRMVCVFISMVLAFSLAACGSTSSQNSDGIEREEESTDSNTPSKPEKKMQTRQIEIDQTPFYGIWCDAYRDESAAEDQSFEYLDAGLDTQVVATMEWSNLSPGWYAICAGAYATKKEAKYELSKVQEYCPDAYVKYSGNWQEGITEDAGGIDEGDLDDGEFYDDDSEYEETEDDSLVGVWRGELSDESSKITLQFRDDGTFGLTIMEYMDVSEPTSVRSYVFTGTYTKDEDVINLEITKVNSIMDQYYCYGNAYGYEASMNRFNLTLIDDNIICVEVVHHNNENEEVGSYSLYVTR